MIDRVFIATTVLFSVLSSHSLSQTIKELITTENSYKKIDDSLVIKFPEDHGAHPNFKTEWWYLTANLSDDQNEPLGIQWTLFRTALSSVNNNQNGWSNKQVWMGHAALTDKDSHFFEEKIARGGIGQAGVTLEPFNAWIDNWKLNSENFRAFELSAITPDFSYDLYLKVTGPIVKHGKNGYSKKSNSEGASAYYSFPFLSVKGWIKKGKVKKEVSGIAWLDREWSSQTLAKTQVGWDWFSLSMQTGGKLMLFRVRSSDGNHFYSGTWINNLGVQTELLTSDILFLPTDYDPNSEDPPTKWKVQVPKLLLSINIDALNKNAFMKTTIPYWEGPISFFGTHAGTGYLEMTGYE